MGLSRRIYDKVGGFSFLKFGEDIEFSHRLIESGAKIVFIDSPVYHKRRTSLKKFFRQVNNWGMARVSLFKMNASMFEPVYLLPAAATIYGILVILLTLISIIVPAVRTVAFAGLLSVLIYLALVAISGGWHYRSWRVGLLLPIVTTIQIGGYGWGLLVNFVRRFILKRDITAELQRDYYGKN